LIGWLPLLKYGLIAAVIGGAIYWLTGQYSSGVAEGKEAGYSAGYIEGKKDGDKEGRAAGEPIGYAKGFEAGKAAGAEEATKAVSAAAAEERAKLTDGFREIERKWNEQAFASQLRASAAIETLNADIAAARDELRDARTARANSQIRIPNCRGGVPQAPRGYVPQAVPEGLLFERAEGRIIEIGGDAERLNIEYERCTSELNRLKSPLQNPSTGAKPNENNQGSSEKAGR